MIEAKVTGKWNSPNEEWIRKYCIGLLTEEQIQDRVKFTHSILMECIFCQKETWRMITLNQGKGKESIKCHVCNQSNFI